MALFHVFVDGSTDGSSAGTSRLATAIANQYGLPAADLLARLEKGRFRVKGNIDRATAEQYVRDLQRLGARCTIEEATAQNSQRVTPTPFPAITVRTPSTPPATKSTARPIQSGLAAALASNSVRASLGALEQDGAALSLSSVDGDEVASPSDGAFAPPPSAAKSKPAKPKDEPVDLFAPPDAQAAELVMELAPDEVESKRKRVSTPPAGQPTAESTTQPTPRTTSRATSQPTSRATSQPSSESTSQPDPQAASQRSTGRIGPLAEPRVRFAAGVLLAVVLGFVPAHLVAALREKSTFAAIDARVSAAQAQADTPETYAALDSMRASERANKESAQRNAALIALAVWALAGGGIAFGWFRKIPWDRYA